MTFVVPLNSPVPYVSIARLGSHHGYHDLIEAECAGRPIDAARALPVGGMTSEGMPAWRAAGADNFGLGSYLDRGKLTAEAAADAAAVVAAVRGQ